MSIVVERLVAYALKALTSAKKNNSRLEKKVSRLFME